MTSSVTPTIQKKEIYLDVIEGYPQNVKEKLKGVTHLTLSGGTDKDLPLLRGLSLQSLKITNPTKMGQGVSDKGLSCLREFSKLHSLELDCQYQVSEKGLNSLVGLPLIHLDVAGCSKVNDKALKVIAQFKLQYLRLHSCTKITDNGLSSLQDLPLRELDLQICHNITDISLISTLSKIKTLKSLHLQWNRNITNQGLKALSTQIFNRLYLHFCEKVTMEGLKHLKFEYLGLVGCNALTKEDIAQLKEDNPGSGIKWRKM